MERKKVLVLLMSFMLVINAVIPPFVYADELEVENSIAEQVRRKDDIVEDDSNINEGNESEPESNDLEAGEVIPEVDGEDTKVTEEPSQFEKKNSVSALSTDDSKEDELKGVAAENTDFEIEDGVLIRYTGQENRVTIPDGVIHIGDRAFANCVDVRRIIVPEGVESIGAHAFEYCENLVGIELPESLETIGAYAFAHCGSIANIIIPREVRRIEEFTFFYCSDLTGIGPATGLEYIGAGAFKNCGQLKNIIIPEQQTVIESETFYECPIFADLEIPSNVTRIEKDAFAYSWSVDYGAKSELIIPESVVYIGDSAFQNRSFLKIKLSENITIIDEYAFSGCHNVLEIKMPDKLEKIASNAFSRCERLQSVVIPQSVTTIEAGAFSFNYKLKNIEILNDQIQLENNIFQNAASELSIWGNVDSSAQIYAEDYNITFRSFDSEKSFNINYVLDGGENHSENPSNYKERNNSDNLKEAEKKGYIFRGWIYQAGYSSDFVNYIPAYSWGDKTLYAKWTPQEFDIEFDSNGGEEFSGKKVEYDAWYGDLPTPTRSGCKFKGWYTAKSGGSEVTPWTIVNIFEDQTLYARWEKELTVTFNPNGGTVNSKSKLLFKDDFYGILPGANRTGYDFIGWYTDKTKGKQVEYSDIVQIAEDHTLYARWSPAEYEIGFDSNGGASHGIISRPYNSNYGSLPTPTRRGYKFIGWYTAKSGGSKVTSSTKMNTAKYHVLYAHWEKAYVVTFNPNGGAIKNDYKTVSKGEAYGTLPLPTKSKYAFKGWYTKKSGGTKITKNTKVALTKNQTVYAQWSKVSVSQGKISKLTNKKGEKIDVAIKKISGVKGYQVEYSTNKNFKKSTKKITTTASLTLTSLSKNKTYYVRVRGYKLDSRGKEVYGVYSVAHNIKIKK